MTQAGDVAVGSAKRVGACGVITIIVKVHFQVAGGLGPEEARAFDGEVEPGALGRPFIPAVMEKSVIAAGQAAVHVFALLGGIPEGIQFDETAQAKFRFGEGGHRQQQ